MTLNIVKPEADSVYETLGISEERLSVIDSRGANVLSLLVEASLKGEKVADITLYYQKLIEVCETIEEVTLILTSFEQVRLNLFEE